MIDTLAVIRLKLLDIVLDKIITAAAVITAFYILNSTDKTNEELCLYLSNVCEKSFDYLSVNNFNYSNFYHKFNFHSMII